MSAESLNRDEDKFNPTVDAEELTTLEEVFDGLEIPAPAPILGEDGSVVASGFSPGSAAGPDVGPTAGPDVGPAAGAASGSSAEPASGPTAGSAPEPVAIPASGPARGSAVGPVAPKPTSGPATKPTPRTTRATSRTVPGAASGSARTAGPASGSAPEASTPPEAEAYPIFPSSTPRAGRHARTDGRSTTSAVSSTSAASSASAASSDDAADLPEAPGRSGQTTAVRRRSLFARTSVDDAGAPRSADRDASTDRPGPARAATTSAASATSSASAASAASAAPAVSATSAPSAPDTAQTPPGITRARFGTADPRPTGPAREQTGDAAEEPTGKPAEESTTPAWLAREADRAQRRSSRRSRQRSDDDILLDGSTIVGRPASRAGAHWAGVLMSLVLLPMAWFFVHGAADALTRTVEPRRFAFSPSAITELVAGLLIMSLALWTARRSSLGSIVVGALSAVLGLLFLLLPTPMNGLVGPVLDRLTVQSTLGADLAAYFWTDAFSGKFVVLGLFMVMVGIVSHSARRAGRREQEIINRGRRF